MKIIDILNKKDYMLSFEVFPPKTDSNYESVAQAVKKIGALHPVSSAERVKSNTLRFSTIRS